jgi:hypothetical protein
MSGAATDRVGGDFSFTSAFSDVSGMTALPRHCADSA